MSKTVLQTILEIEEAAKHLASEDGKRYRDELVRPLKKVFYDLEQTRKAHAEEYKKIKEKFSRYKLYEENGNLYVEMFFSDSLGNTELRKVLVYLAYKESEPVLKEYLEECIVDMGYYDFTNEERAFHGILSGDALSGKRYKMRGTRTVSLQEIDDKVKNYENEQYKHYFEDLKSTFCVNTNTNH